MELKKIKCSKCGELRITVDESGKCILCRSYGRSGTEVKPTGNKNAPGVEVKSNTGSYKTDNAWMRK